MINSEDKLDLNKDNAEDQNRSNEIFDELVKVNANLQSIAKKSNIREGKDTWEKLQVIVSFISSVLFAGVGIYFTHSFNKSEANRQEKFQDAQIDISQITAITNLTPLLASKDDSVKRFAWFALEAIYKKQNLFGKGIFDKSTSEDIAFIYPDEKENSILSIYAEIALSNRHSIKERQANVTLLAKAALDPKTNIIKKQEAINYLSDIANKNDIKIEVAGLAREYLKEIKAVQHTSIGDELNKITTDRDINRIIIGHSYMPDSKTYKGLSTVHGIAKLSHDYWGWSTVGWHFLVAPDGIIWFGRPLNKVPAIVTDYNKGTIAVEIVLNGDVELPSTEQKKSLGVLLNALGNKFKIDLKDNFMENTGFVRDYLKHKTSPGKRISKKMVLECIENVNK